LTNNVNEDSYEPKHMAASIDEGGDENGAVN
jgi:hypothetical protein